MKQPVILCGLGRIGARVLEYLTVAGTPVVVVDTRCAPDDPRLAGARLVIGDCRRPEVLRDAGIDRVRAVLVLTSEDLINISTALLARSLRRDIRIIVRLFNANLLARLGKAVENTFALSTSALTAPVLALIARTGEALGAIRLEDGRCLQIKELEVQPESPLEGRTVGEVAHSHHTQVLAHDSANGPALLLHEVRRDAQLQAGDRLVLCGEPPKLAPLLAQSESESLPQLLMAGWLKRLWRMASTAFAEIDLALKLATAALLLVILGSALVFTFTMERDTFADAMYRTISLMATGADMRERELNPWQKVFVSALRILGAALTAVFTAILASYLVRAELRGALEVRRIPDSGHVVVCGLGNVGFRVVEELVADGERVVAIERHADNPFVTTARRQGVAVIIGDAVVPEVMRQAKASSAKAVVACTSNDLVNLEIALLTRDLNPTQRVVVRLTDATLAKTLRDAAHIRLALSVPELTAPAFVAALLGDRVQSVFFVAGRLVAVIDLAVQPEDEFLGGREVQSLVDDYGLMPLLLRSSEGKSQIDMLGTRLKPGDCLTAVVTFGDLQRLLQRERISVPAAAGGGAAC